MVFFFFSCSCLKTLLMAVKWNVFSWNSAKQRSQRIDIRRKSGTLFQTFLQVLRVNIQLTKRYVIGFFSFIHHDHLSLVVRVQKFTNFRLESRVNRTTNLLIFFFPLARRFCNALKNVPIGRRQDWSKMNWILVKLFVILRKRKYT